MAAFLDLCRFIAAAGGTADWTYSSTVSPYISPAAAGAVNGRVYKVRAESADLTQWEVSEGAYSSAGAGSFARTTVLYNSAGTGTLQGGAGAKISFTVAPQVWVVASKRDLISVEEANSFTAAQKTQAKSNIGLSTPVSVAEGGTGVADIPSFHVRRSGTQSIPSGIQTKVQFNVEEWDTAGAFDNATNYRFQPAVAGKYHVGCSITLLNIPAGITYFVSVFKNGSEWKRGRDTMGAVTNTGTCAVTCLVDLNGSTDYLEFYIYHETASARDVRGDVAFESFAYGARVAP